MQRVFSENFVTVIKGQLASLRGVEAQQLQVLSMPHPFSPFLTLSETRLGLGIPSYVIKVLLALKGLPTYEESWQKIFHDEAERLEKELKELLGQAERSSAASLLRLPLLVDVEKEPLVRVDQLKNLLRHHLLASESGRESEILSLDYMLRPYVLLPSLADCGDMTMARDAWKKFCDRRGLSRDEDLFLLHFYHEALVLEGKSKEAPDVVLTSGWRYQR
jgi:hypothetical protein